MQAYRFEWIWRSLTIVPAPHARGHEAADAAQCRVLNPC